jgi:hypothetical protein
MSSHQYSRYATWVTVLPNGLTVCDHDAPRGKRVVKEVKEEAKKLPSSALSLPRTPNAKRKSPKQSVAVPVVADAANNSPARAVADETPPMHKQLRRFDDEAPRSFARVGGGAPNNAVAPNAQYDAVADDAPNAPDHAVPNDAPNVPNRAVADGANERNDRPPNAPDDAVANAPDDDATNAPDDAVAADAPNAADAPHAAASTQQFFLVPTGKPGRNNRTLSTPVAEGKVRAYH